jgi:hypothetical protein
VKMDHPSATLSQALRPHFMFDRRTAAAVMGGVSRCRRRKPPSPHCWRVAISPPF